MRLSAFPLPQCRADNTIRPMNVWWVTPAARTGRNGEA
jgi:hypothetical protein